MPKQTKTKVGIAGCGVTGAALYNYFYNRGETNLDIRRVDPAKEYNDSLTGCAFVFVCVPTPILSSGSQDLSYLMQAIASVPDGILVVVRSTILPGTTKALAQSSGRQLAHLPEFLTERRATLDMFEHKLLYLGADNFTNEVWGGLIQLFPDKLILPVKSAEAELIKYTHNCFEALKVTYFNAVYDYCQNLGVDYATVREGALKATEFMSPAHTLVPGPDGQRGYGGKCFPDNVKSLAFHARDHILGSMLRFVDRANGLWRGEQ